jgi:uncharacterized protein (TIGR02118 family)
MIHALYFITRKPSITDGEFHRYWKEVHGPIARQIKQMRRYVQSHRIPFPGQNSPYDGAAEVWLEDDAALTALQQSPEYQQGALVDEPNFIDMSRVEWLATQDHAIIDRPAGPQLVKILFTLKRQAGFTLAEGRRYWLEVHGPLVAALPGLRRYVQCHTIDAAYRYAEPRWDGVAQLWFDDTSAVQRMLDSPYFRETAWADTAKFVNMATIESFVAQEHQVIV